MNSLTDQQLLRDYTGCRSETAFAELVRRHVDFVYSAALRMVCDAHLAEDVTQGAFVALAQNARQLANHPVLSGWLHRTAQNLAANAVRSEVRRRAREQEVAAMNQLLATESDAPWEIIAPHLDAALGELNEAERDAVLLRYFERKSAGDMAEILGTSEDAAQKRVSRAVERLREFFTKHNVTIGASGLVVLISANAVQSAPIGLAAAISTAAVLTGTAISTSTAIATTKIIAMTTLQKALITIALAAAVGTGIFEAHQNSKLQNQIQTLQQHQAPLAEQLAELQRERDDATNQLAGLLAANAQLKSNSNENELLKLRSKVTQLQNEANDPTDATAKALVAKVNKLKQRLEETPNAKIPELQFLTEQDWINAVIGRLETEGDYRRALASLRTAAEYKFVAMLYPALTQYMQANNKQFPTDLAQLQPYFDSPMDDAILQRWGIVSTKNMGGMNMGGDWNITQKGAVDEMFDTSIVLGSHGYGGGNSILSTEIEKTMEPVCKAYLTANGNEFTDPSQLLSYATTPEQQAAVKKLIEQNELIK